MNKFRYPGTKPFSKEESHLFFGRENDIEQLYSLIRLEQVVVLFGKSGLGKSSLINAGITNLVEEDNCNVIFVRFGSKFSDNGDTLHSIFRRRITNHNIPPNYLNKIIDNSDSFWYVFKSLQLESKANAQYLIVFDQFEEIFTYVDEVDDFAHNLAELLSPNVPFSYRGALQRKMQDYDDLLTNEEIDQLYKPLSIKILISMRSDRLSLLNRFAIHIPGILKKCYELLPLSSDMAKNAMIKPALLSSHDFESPTFTYTPGLLNFIMQYLSGNHTSGIESFQLQLVCEYFEKRSIGIGKKDKNAKIEFDDGPRIREEIPNITTKFYENIIKSFSSNIQRSISIFIEEGLILEEERRRISLYKGQIIKNFGISNDVLNQLVDKRIIRAESYSGTPYYELSHDTLVEPVLLAKRYRILKEEGERQQKEFEAKRKLDAEMYNREKARELAKLDKKAFELSTSQAIKNKYKFYISQIKLKEAKQYIRSLSAVILFFLFFLVCVVWSVIATVKAINKQSQINATSDKVQKANTDFEELLKSYDSTQNPAKYKQLKDLYHEYSNIQR